MSLRYDWYQTDQKVVVTVMMKNAMEKEKENDFSVNIEEQRLRMTADQKQLDVYLYAPIRVEGSFHKTFPTKIEITLIKNTGVRWTTLEQKQPPPEGHRNALEPAGANGGVENFAAANAPPAMHRINWDQLVREVEKSEEEEAQSEEALQRLFRRIYSTSSPEVQKAMNKSFRESGGTVLSTNWSDVSKGEVEVKPPEGAEFRKWN